MTKTKPPPKADDGALRSAMARLLKTPLPALRARFQKATGKDPAALDRDALVKALATMGAPPDEAPTKATTTRPPRPSKRKRDERFPAPGGSVTREYKGKTYTLEVLTDGFKVGEKVFRSPTAAALSIVPYRAVSGPVFWGLTKSPKAPEAPAPATPPAPAKKKAGRPISPKRR